MARPATSYRANKIPNLRGVRIAAKAHVRLLPGTVLIDPAHPNLGPREVHEPPYDMKTEKGRIIMKANGMPVQLVWRRATPRIKATNWREAEGAKIRKALGVVTETPRDRKNRLARERRAAQRKVAA